MPLTEPEPFEDALNTLRKRLPTGSKRNTAEWARQSSAVRERAFFSATIESVRFLQRAKNFIMDYLERNIELLDTGETALKADGRERFVRDMARFAIQEGLGPVGIPVSQVNPDDLTDIRSEARLRLIFDTQVKQAAGYGFWTQGMEPEVLEQFPAARFVRLAGVDEKRPRHAASEGAVRLKSDTDWWAFYQNDVAIGGFSVPWPPYGFNSKMDQEDVSREEAEALGLIPEGKAVEWTRGPAFNSTLKASIRGLDPELKRKLEMELGTTAAGNEIKPEPRIQPDLPGLN